MYISVLSALLYLLCLGSRISRKAPVLVWSEGQQIRDSVVYTYIIPTTQKEADRLPFCQSMQVPRLANGNGTVYIHVQRFL